VTYRGTWDSDVSGVACSADAAGGHGCNVSAIGVASVWELIDFKDEEVHVTFRIGRRVLATMAVSVPLLLTLAVTTTGYADTAGQVAGGEAAAVTPPQPGETLTNWVRRNTFPQRTGCVSATVETTGGPGPSMSVRCTPTINLDGIPATVPVNFQSHPSIEVVLHVMTKTGASLSVARNAVAKAAGVNSWELGALNVGQWAQLILDNALSLAPAGAGVAAHGHGPVVQLRGSVLCGRSGGVTQCTQLSKSMARIAWGAGIGAAVGGVTGVGAGLGAAIGGLIGALWDWLFG
jgi:hypothetical protein